MVLGWRRAFCTSIPRERDPTSQKEKQEQRNNNNSTPKFGFFSNSNSNPSTPRLQSQPSLRCRTTATAPASAASVPVSPKLQCKTQSNSPMFFQRSSNPSSPRSPSTFSLLKSTLRLSKSRCGICLQSVKRGQGMAIFTAECSHSFHFPCIASHVKKQGSLTCPVCSSLWKEMPLLTVQNSHQKQQQIVEEKKREKLAARMDDVAKKNERKQHRHLRPDLKVYNDDEPLTPLTPTAKFNPIPESDENFDEDSGEFQGFFVNGDNINSPIGTDTTGNVEVRLSPEAAVVSVGRSYETYAIVLKVRAPKGSARTERRAPIDLVTVVDLSGSMTSEKLQMMKRAMGLVVSSLSSSDRLSIVAFSSSSKRLLPLRRMTTNGRRSARRIVDALAVLEGTSIASDAVKKAAKVLEDRRERNPIASIMLLSDDQLRREKQSYVSSTRHSHMEIPIHSVTLDQTDPSEDVFSKCVEGLLNVVVQDLKLQLGFASGSSPAEIAAVYSYTTRPVALGSGTIRVGNLCAEEGRELLVELKVPSSTAMGAHQVLSVRCSYRDSVTQELVYGTEQALLVPHPHTVRSSAPGIQRLRSLFITTRALAESRKLAERNDLTGAYHMLVSARVLMLQSNSGIANEFILGLEAELMELQRKWHNQQGRLESAVGYVVDEKGGPLTPTSAWRVAERLAKVAMMRKSLNRVSDLHGFEDARF